MPQVNWVFQEQWDRRDHLETPASQVLQEWADWPVYQDRWDPSDQLGHLARPDQAIVLALMTWRVQGDLALGFLELEDKKDDRVLRVYLGYQARLVCLGSLVRREVRGHKEEMADLGWMAFLDLRDQGVTQVTEVKEENLVEMELDSKDHLAHLDPQDRLSTKIQATTMVYLEVPDLREDLVYQAKLDSLALWGQKVTKGTRDCQDMELRGKRESLA